MPNQTEGQSLNRVITRTDWNLILKMLQDNVGFEAGEEKLGNFLHDMICDDLASHTV